MRSNAIEEYKRNLHLSDIQREVLIGTLLGDGHLETRADGRIWRLKIEHTHWQKEYVWWLYGIFRAWTLTAPQLKINGLYKKYWFSTVSHGALRFYGQQFYRNKKKILPKLIHRWLSPLVLAVWFMDDGSVKSKKHRALILNTQSFTRLEIVRLQDILLKKFGIETTLRRQDRKSHELYQLLMSGVNAERFADIIRPHLLPAMRYKLGLLETQLPKK